MNTNNAKDNFDESKRVKQFRLGIAKSIPKFPNNKETLSILESKSLGLLLIDYINWASRLIAPRSRLVTIEPSLTADPRWKLLSANTKALLERVRRGDDLNPNLSLKVTRNGFTPSSSNTTSTDKWQDKDFILNTMGYHHFHLSPIVEIAGHTKRTDEVLFAKVEKNNFYAIGFFDHSVFDSTNHATKEMSKERSRLWQIFDQRNSIGLDPGSTYLSSAITSSGHTVKFVQLASDYAWLVNKVDKNLDDLSYREDLFKQNDVPINELKGMDLRWHMNFLNLGLLDRKTSKFYVLQYWP